MQFKFLALASVALSAVQALTPNDVVDGIQGITQKSAETEKSFKDVKRIGFLIRGAQGGLKGLEGIVELANKNLKVISEATRPQAAAANSKAEPEPVTTSVRPQTTMAIRARQSTGIDFDLEGQNAICQAFIIFVRVHQDLLATVIGDKGLLSLTPFTKPIGSVLRVLEGVVDNLAFSIIGLVPGCAEQANKEKAELDMSLQKAVATYN